MGDIEYGGWDREALPLLRLERGVFLFLHLHLSRALGCHLLADNSLVQGGARRLT